MRNKKIFEILYPNYHGVDWKDCATIEALDHEQAAEKWAEEDDQQGDYTIIGYGGSEEIHVREQGQSDIKTFKVYAKSRAYYSAIELR
jgi:hypothetical protein